MSPKILLMGLLLVLGLLVGLPADAQQCQWTDKGGKDLTWVKLMWFERDPQSKEPEAQRPIIGFTKDSRYQKYKGKPELKKFQVDADLLREWVPEIFGEGGGKKVDAYYFLSDDAFAPSEEFKDQDTIPLEVGHKFEKGIPCAMFPDKYMGFQKVEEIKDGRVVSTKWYSPIAIDILNRKKKSDPLIYFGVLFGVVALCVVLGLVGVKIGDKERALDENWDEALAGKKQK